MLRLNKSIPGGAFPPVFLIRKGDFYTIDRIIKPTSKQTIDAILSGDFSTVDKIGAAAKRDARQVFDAVASGSSSGTYPGSQI